MQLNDIAESHPHYQVLSCPSNGRIESILAVHIARLSASAAHWSKLIQRQWVRYLELVPNVYPKSIKDRESEREEIRKRIEKNIPRTKLPSASDFLLTFEARRKLNVEKHAVCQQ